MKCYLCKLEVSAAHRVFLTARNQREKDAFRDFCDTCHHKHMSAKGFVLMPSANDVLPMWVQEHIVRSRAREIVTKLTGDIDWDGVKQATSSLPAGLAPFVIQELIQVMWRQENERKQGWSFASIGTN